MEVQIRSSHAACCMPLQMTRAFDNRPYTSEGLGQVQLSASVVAGAVLVQLAKSTNFHNSKCERQPFAQQQQEQSVWPRQGQIPLLRSQNGTWLNHDNQMQSFANTLAIFYSTDHPLCAIILPVSSEPPGTFPLPLTLLEAANSVDKRTLPEVCCALT
jgi:hypothetical protein